MKTLNQLKSFFSHAYYDKNADYLCNMNRTLEYINVLTASLKILHPGEEIGFDWTTDGWHAYVYILGKSIDIDIREGKVIEEGANNYTAPHYHFSYNILEA